MAASCHLAAAAVAKHSRHCSVRVGAPGMIAKHLDLCRGGNSRYQKTAAYGHFGRDDPDFTWETTKKLEL